MAGLHLHQSEDLTEAVERLASTLANAGLGLLEKPWLVVPSAGIRQWLDGHLSENLGTGEGTRDGITANLSYFFPEQLVSEVEHLVLKELGKPHLNWSKELLALRIFGQNSSLDFAHARRLGEIVDNLNRWRPETLVGSGREEFAEVKGAYEQLSSYGLRPHEQRRLVLETLRAGKSGSLPSVIALIGLTNMPGGRQFGEMLAALSNQCEVYIFEPVTTLHEVVREPKFLPARWNSEVGEAKSLYLELAQAHGVVVTTSSVKSDATSTLANLQESFRSGQYAPVAEADDSVKVIGSYGNSRQVETLRAELLAILNDPKLEIEPHEILVVTPDLPSFGPLLERHWLYERNTVGVPRLPIDYAERPSGHWVTRLDASLELLRMIGTRVTVEQVSSFVAIPAVSEALDLEPEEQDRLWALASENKVMAGTSNEQRADFELMPRVSTSGVPINVGTWERFIDGVVTTYTMPAEAITTVRAIGTIDDAYLLSRLLPLLHVLEGESSLRTSATRLNLSSWLDRLEGWVSELIPATDTDRSFERQLLKFRGWVGELPESIDISFLEFQELWRGDGGSATSPNVFGRGGVVVSGLSALPNVPFKVVALIGFDEANLPGATAQEGLTGERRIGEPSPRQSMLQALVQGVMSAQERLVITYNANSDESGEPIEPAIPLEELIEGLVVLTGGTFKTITTSRHEFFLSPKDQTGKTHDPRVRDLAGLENDLPTATLNFAEFLDPQRAERKVVTVQELLGFYKSPQRFFLESVMGVQPPSWWPESSGGVSFGWDRWTSPEIHKELVRQVRDYVRTHPEIDSMVHLVTGEEIIKKSLVKRNAELAAAFDDYYASLLEGLRIDTAKTGAIPPVIWQTAIDRDTIAYEAFTLEAEFERFEEVDPLFPRTFTVGEWTIDAGGELGDREEAEFTMYRELHSGGRRLVEVVSKKDRYWIDKEGPITRAHLRIMIGLLLLKVAGVEETSAELLYLEEPSINRYGSPRGVGIVPIECNLTTSEASELLAEILGVYSKVWNGPVPLFPKTTFAVASGGSGVGAWESDRNATGEGSYSENLVLYPYGYEELKALLSNEGQPKGELPYSSDLIRWQAAFKFGEIKTGDSELSPRVRAGLEAAQAEGTRP
jgi:exodeoxyribonuclease V gamma subunit